MPPFREGQIEVDRRFNGEGLHALRDIGHGHMVNVVDASFDIPENARVIDYPGSSADCLLSIVRLIPVEHEEVVVMAPDPSFTEDTNPVGFLALAAFTEALSKLYHDDNYDDVVISRLFRKDDQYTDGKGGFYSLANDPATPKLYFRTTDDLPFACASLIAGHSQRTDI